MAQWDFIQICLLCVLSWRNKNYIYTALPITAPQKYTRPPFWAHLHLVDMLDVETMLPAFSPQRTVLVQTSSALCTANFQYQADLNNHSIKLSGPQIPMLVWEVQIFPDL